MKINTKFHGEKDINEKEIIHFPKGIPAFEEEKRFVILTIDEQENLFILQSIINKGLGFVIANPFVFFKDYEFELEDYTLSQLELDSEKDVLIFTILTLQQSFQESTVNLMAPIIINLKNKRAQQVILNLPHYKTKHSIFSQKQSEVIKG
ncbi:MULTISPECIES: flagellar assembly protein FliW [Bacillaceae]|uniref:flagellar assembly protein FliW n=1 Tax=Bacillaceae TaxID=186817 RepID=UPI001F407076|nr:MULTISPECIES: flagellar assembly protein FliW [Bacillaceae]MCF2649513.1 flagellar assembly protein FliW [Niallia circulans]CAI9385721.1 Flagellar assembly factor FliW [Bacillus sp. T2.9-1]